jgi:nucleoside-diphosphate-sugar epimerase
VSTVLVTGAGGFIGRRLVDVLLRGVSPGGARNDRLRLLDREFGHTAADGRVEAIAGDLTNAEDVSRAFADDVDTVFHLASVPGGASEQNFEPGLQANLNGTLALLEAARKRGRRPRFVFASTIGVYGVPMPAVIDEDTVPGPSMSYGAHKYIGEVLVTDYTRKGFVDGISLRLPGIVARPSAGGMLSAFMSEMIRRVAAGEPFVCPVSAHGKAWWMSRSRVVDNLLHASTLPRDVLQRRGAWLLPVQRASMAEVVEALAKVHGPDRVELVSYEPSEALEAQFARLPPLKCPSSEAAGFRHDGTLEELVQRALDGP